jgi:hypothetical protein
VKTLQADLFFSSADAFGDPAGDIPSLATMSQRHIVVAAVKPAAIVLCFLIGAVSDLEIRLQRFELSISRRSPPMAIAKTSV